MKDLFKTPEKIPMAIRAIFAEIDDDLSYKELEILKEKVESLGYTFDYYLDAVPYNLRKINKQTYMACKIELTNASKRFKKAYKGDKPMIREAINNYADVLMRDLSHPSNDYGRKRLDRYEIWLFNHAAKLQP